MKALSTLLALVICLALPAKAQQELIASKTLPQYATLRPLTNGLSAISLMWPYNDLAQNRVEAAYAGLATVIGGATDTLTAFEAETFREINSIDMNLTLLPNHLMLTLTAPDAGFSDALDHLHTLLTNPNFSHPWYARQTVQQRPLLATKTRRPENLVGSLTDYLQFPLENDGTDTSGIEFVFGMPSQIVLRTQSDDAQGQINQVIDGLPRQNETAQQPKAEPIDLPRGVIFAPDPDSLETLIYVVKSETFDGPDDMVGANLLMNYIGAHQGSEMFRIIRQELRAAYSPASDFEQLAKNRALLGLSATVLSEEWPAILSEINAIYDNVRSGNATDQGLSNTKRRLLGGLDWRFSTNPGWGAMQYMNEYAEGASGQIDFPLFRASVNADLAALRANGTDHLPAFDDFLVILIGGTNPVPDAMKANGYCEQPLSKSLRHCLRQLR